MRSTLCRFSILCFSAAAFTQPAPPPTPQAPPITAVLGVSIVVSDLDAAIAWYGDALTFRPLTQTEAAGPEHERAEGQFGLRTRTATLALGEERIELREFLAPQGRPIPPDSRSNDAWFQHIAIVVSDIDSAYRRLRLHRVRHASSGPQTLPAWNPDAGGISAFYFKDPDGHVIEVIDFPEGKGDPRWQTAKQSGSLFLGIDHTAIVVRDTARSLQFYEHTLGMRIAGTAENYGAEQEHLNNVFGARLRITALRAPKGPGVELLEYLAPGDGKPYPADSVAADLWSWQTILASPAAALTPVNAPSIDWISPGLIILPDGLAVTTVRDPDGHRVQLRGIKD